MKVGTVPIFTPFNFAALFTCEIREIKGTQTLRVLQYTGGRIPLVLLREDA